VASDQHQNALEEHKRAAEREVQHCKYLQVQYNDLFDKSHDSEQYSKSKYFEMVSIPFSSFIRIPKVFISVSVGCLTSGRAIIARFGKR
jgi:hypothetical protein